MEQSISTISNISPASFSQRGNRTFLQTEYICKLLTWGIENNIAITRDDIIDCYVDFRFHNVEIVREMYFDFFEKTYVHKEYTKEQFRKKVYRPTALGWFKNNLGAAILKGSILAIPIINIDK